MRTYTAIEAGHELGKSERTIRRWIEAGKLQADKRASNEFAIPESEIERLRQEDQDGDQDQDGRLEDLEKKYNDLLARVAVLEQERARRLEARESIGRELEARAARPAATRSTTYERAGPGAGLWQEQEAGPLPDNVPAGSILASDFALKHQVNRSTFHGHLTIGLVPRRGMPRVTLAHIAIPGRTAKEEERYLSPEQQAATIRYWQRFKVAYEPCTACPHAQVGVTAETTVLEGDSAALAENDL